MKRKMSNAAALIGIAFLLGTVAVGCEKETTTTVPVPVAGEPGPAGAPGAPGAPGAAASPSQASEKTSESSTTTTNDSNPGGSTTTTEKSSTQKTNYSLWANRIGTLGRLAIEPSLLFSIWRT